ncbi:hypothetical protein ABAC460_23505 [Asticcacaulis sp. AC460]|uniref:SRPBCC family protein n=1 Tax=Asticcacaulis sp. AC460 TaxID=1282360 RepID=UPI0003C40C90|nr:SRPBCC domain-containing protein [Asticcacaulis sp. AC460]ESQ85566.1 hypothetical protein ABAC460_23505 [Asticcacaulis sp. AC460]
MFDTELTTEANDLILVRDFAAPRALVYRAWSDPQMLAAWWGPEGLTTTVEVDVRPGGALSLIMHDGKGNDYPVLGEFGEVVENELLVMIMQVERHPPEWHAMIRGKFVELGGDEADYVGGPVPTRITFADSDAGTRVTVRQTFPLALVRDAHVALGNPVGWRGSFTKLDSLLARTA